MAIYSESDRRQIDELCAAWRTNSLLGDTSLLHPDDFPSCWSDAELAELNRNFWGDLLEGEEGGGTGPRAPAE